MTSKTDTLICPCSSPERRRVHVSGGSEPELKAGFPIPNIQTECAHYKLESLVVDGRISDRKQFKQPVSQNRRIIKVEEEYEIVSQRAYILKLHQMVLEMVCNLSTKAKARRP